VSRAAERLVELTADDGQILRGVLHDPPGGTDLPPVIMFSGWGGTRYGPNGMLVEAARRLAADGRRVLRVDFRGRGDSDGAVDEHDLRAHIVDGAAMVRWSRDHLADVPPVLLGICSGGEVAVGCLFDGVDVDSVCLWSAPVFAAQATDERISAKRAGYLREYLRKLFRPETWRKLFAGEVRFDIIRRVLGRAGVHEKKEDEPEELSDESVYPARCGAALMIYGTADPIAEEAIAAYEGLFGRTSCPVELHRIEGANHGFYALEWKHRVIDLTLEWLGRRSHS
jgi:pimeloyl-ACP methyl ester carboxylesterase